jgi:hypothetical protein
MLDNLLHISRTSTNIPVRQLFCSSTSMAATSHALLITQILITQKNVYRLAMNDNMREGGV